MVCGRRPSGGRCCATARGEPPPRLGRAPGAVLSSTKSSALRSELRNRRWSWLGFFVRGANSQLRQKKGCTAAPLALWASCTPLLPLSRWAQYSPMCLIALAVDYERIVGMWTSTEATILLKHLIAFFPRAGDKDPLPSLIVGRSRRREGRHVPVVCWAGKGTVQSVHTKELPRISMQHEGSVQNDTCNKQTEDTPKSREKAR